MKQCRVRLEIRQLFTTDPRSGENGRGGNQTTTATGRGQSVNALTRQQILRRDFSTRPTSVWPQPGSSFASRYLEWRANGSASFRAAHHWLTGRVITPRADSFVVLA